MAVEPNEFCHKKFGNEIFEYSGELKPGNLLACECLVYREGPPLEM